MDTVNNTLNNSENQEPTGPDSDEQGYKNDIPNPLNLDSILPDSTIPLSQIFWLGSEALRSIATDEPLPETFPKGQAISASGLLWEWSMVALIAEKHGSKEQLLYVLTLLLKKV